MPVEEEEPIHLLYDITVDRDTCTSIVVVNSASSAALYIGNQHLICWCSSIKAGLELCLPLLCE
jgi:hypothetical protein